MPKYRNVGILLPLHQTLKIESVRRGTQLRDLLTEALTEYCEGHGLPIEADSPDTAFPDGNPGTRGAQ